MNEEKTSLRDQLEAEEKKKDKECEERLNALLAEFDRHLGVVILESSERTKKEYQFLIVRNKK